VTEHGATVTDSGDSGADTTWKPGTAEVLGRYLVLDRLGEGGMGIVYRAYDPALHREVALKVLRVIGPQSAHDRMFREAQALARVTHPHVVTVYDVGAAGADVFVAMELIRGVTLDKWLASSHAIADVLDVCRDAGEGLAAAHAAGLVHRDFKPSNVIVGDDGRVRVLDFGLARPSGSPAVSPAPSGSPDPLSETITRQGAIVGTPRYMAPEQQRGEAADARSDQYSFCVVLVEALTGKREVDPGSLAELPRRVRAACTRGLSADPKARFESMTELLHEIAPARGRTWIATTAALAVVIAGGGVAIAAASSKTPPCDGVGDAFTRMWAEPLRESIHAGFVANGGPLAETTWARVAPVVDDWGARWTGARRSACEATVRGEQSAELLDRRMACLDDRRQELRGVLDGFATADRDIALDAIKLVRALDPVGGCTDATALLQAPPVPADRRVAVEAAKRENADLAVLTHARKADVTARAQRAVDAAKVLGYAPTTADALFQLGHAQGNAGKYVDAVASYGSAALAADRARDDRLRTKSLLERMYLEGASLHHGSDALATGEMAAAALDRVADPGSLNVQLRIYTSEAYQALGKLDRALSEIDAALALATPAMGDELRAVILQDKGEILADLDRWSDDAPLHEQARAIYERVYGSDHPIVAGELSNIANTKLMARTDYAGAEQLYRKALAIEEHAFGSDSPQAATYANNIVNLFRAEERYADAEPFARRAVDIRTRRLPPDHPLTARAVINLATILVALGKGDEAIALFQRGLAMQARSLPPGVYDHAYARQLYGEGLLALGRAKDASRELAAAYDLTVKARGANDQAVEVMAKWARAEAESGDPNSAIAHAGDALAKAEKADDWYDAGLARWARAEAFAALGRTADARADAEHALAKLDDDKANEDAAKLATRIRAWLAKVK
jgi:eukaryotic-like serine/threonine-protein kinase